MAVETYEVFGQMKMGPAGGCPAELHGKKARIKCSEGDIFELPADAVALSLRARKDLLEKGCDQELDYPIKKSVMAKLSEYLKHHKEHACSEIRTPLVSDNLVDCGASRWDASFVNVDKETLFDLTVAATYLDIPGLWFLLSARAAVITNNKTADKLRKEFSMANDFPAAEEAELRREYAAAFKLPDTTDLSQLAASSVIRSGVKAAEYKSGLQPLAEPSSETSSEMTLKSWRHAMWRAAVLDDWKLLANAPEQVKGDRDLVKSAILTSQGAALKYAASELKADQALVLDATKYSGMAFADAAPELRNDKSFLLKAVGAHGGAMSGAPDSMRSDKAFLLEAAKAGKGAAMQGASLALREDRNFVLEMAVHDAEAYRYASEDLLNDKDFAVAVAKRNGKALKFMLPIFKADPDVVRAAISRDPQAAQFAHAARRAELGMTQESIMGEVQLKEELQSQLKAAQDEASSTTALAIAAGPRQVPVQAISGGMHATCMRLQKTVYFTAMSTMTANMGQANYIASNAYMDKIPAYERPEVDAVGLMWGAVGGIGMRWKAFASEDVLNKTPEALLTIPDSSKVLHVACCTMFPPEWFSASHFDEMTRGYYLSPTAGQIKLELSEAAAQSWEKQVNQGDMDKKALEDLPTIDRRPVPNNFANAPLGGWPSLVTSSPAVTMSMPLQKGSKVRLTGLRAKNGVTGILIQQFGDGKWKVKLDDGSGNALLRPGFFEAI
ncbi:unnamed protein product [Durusdinium trenchii]|uniref:SKP1 component POZ domain-containing protein n=2 Tax=Durusdinium trenchii TaxID=1381693 RepID=A0ABP0I865_9DINO